MSKLLMIASAAVMAGAGLVLTFAPLEVLGVLPTVLLPFVQLLGALYLGGAITNWMSKSNLVGGVFGRPLAMGNLAHFGIGAMALVRSAASGQADLRLFVVAAVYVALAAAFGAILFTQPQAATCN